MIRQSGDTTARRPDGAFHLFVYGTLRPGRDGGGPLDGAERVRAATVRGTLYDAGDYPALILAGQTPVEGEIWRCPLDLLDVLDSYEAVREGLFRRVALTVDGTACWAYVAGPRLGPRLTMDRRIDGGRWAP